MSPVSEGGTSRRHVNRSRTITNDVITPGLRSTAVGLYNFIAQIIGSTGGTIFVGTVSDKLGGWSVWTTMGPDFYLAYSRSIHSCQPDYDKILFGRKCQDQR